ncbi:MAG: hypothetical protein AAF654_03800 [Myxococcota bacterium]
MKKLLSALAVLVLAGACVKKANQGAAAKAAPGPQVETLTKSEEDKYRFPVVKKFHRTLEPIWTTVVQQDKNRAAACESSVELEEIAAAMNTLELPRDMEHQEAEWDRSVGELRASVMMFSSMCVNEPEAEVVGIFEPIPAAFEGVLTVVGPKAEAPMTAEATPTPDPAEEAAAQ